MFSFFRFSYYSISWEPALAIIRIKIAIDITAKFFFPSAFLFSLFIPEFVPPLSNVIQNQAFDVVGLVHAKLIRDFYKNIIQLFCNTEAYFRHCNSKKFVAKPLIS